MQIYQTSSTKSHQHI